MDEVKFSPKAQNFGRMKQTRYTVFLYAQTLHESKLVHAIQGMSGCEHEVQPQHRIPSTSDSELALVWYI